MMTSPWRPIGSVPQAPPLLVKYEFTNSQYKVFLTDLTNIWTETLERREIIKKALNLDTSIDPSEDSGQFRLLLRKVQDALEGQEGSHLSLSRGMKSDELVLHTVTKLPLPWEPLRWPFHLACAHAGLLTTELLLPCLSHQFVANAQVESLLHILKEKEHVLNKLADKITSDGVNFADLFPGALGSRAGMRLSREQAGKFVKGLSEFDETGWRDSLSASLISSANLSDIVPQVFAPHSTETLSIDRGAVRRDWISQLTEDSPKILSFAHQPDQSESVKCTTKRKAEDALGDDFQKQEIPTRMKTPNAEKEEKPALGYIGRSKPKQEPVLSDPDSTTADESDLEASVRKPRELTRRGAPVEPSAPALDSRRSPNVFQADPNGTASLTSYATTAGPRAIRQAEAEDGHRDMSQPKIPEAVQKSKGILGKIGGRVKREKESEYEGPPAIVKENLPRDNSTIGYLSSESRQFTQPPPATVSSRALPQPQLSPPLPPPPPRETSQDRANNKREELKRQLESKGNANVKKKRKF